MSKIKSSRLKLKSQELFDEYLLKYETVPSYKKVLSTMIKFEDMYRPIVKGPMFVDPFGHIAEINEQRKFRRTQIYLNKRDLINTFDERRGRRLLVTSRGRKIFYESYPLAKLRSEAWDGVWTLVMYDFPETERFKRRRIRRNLMDFGFGCPQISILISPLPLGEPVQKFLEGKGVAGRVWTLRAERVLGMENREVARKAWPIVGELNALYKELLRVLPEIKGDKQLVSRWKIYFLAVNNADPYLPFELLPEDWKGGACEQEFLRLGRFGVLEAIFAKFSREGF